MNVQIPEKIRRLSQYLENKKKITDKELLYAIKNLNLSISDIGTYVNFNHNINQSYGRFVIYESNKVEIVLMSWNHEDYTSIHDHSYAQWGAVFSFGNIASIH